MVYPAEWTLLGHPFAERALVPTLCFLAGFFAGCTLTAVLLVRTILAEHSVSLFRFPTSIRLANHSTVSMIDPLPRPLSASARTPQFATRLSGKLPNSTLLMTRPLGLLPPAWCTLSALEGGGQLDGSEQMLIAKYVNNATGDYFEWGTALR